MSKLTPAVLGLTLLAGSVFAAAPQATDTSKMNDTKMADTTTKAKKTKKAHKAKKPATTAATTTPTPATK